MKLDRTMVRLSALGAAAILLVPLIVAQVSAFGHVSDRDSFEPRETSRSAEETPTNWVVGASPVIVADSSAPVVGDADTAPNATRRSAPSPAPTASGPSTPSAGSPSTPSVAAASSSSTSVLFRDSVVRRNGKATHWTADKFKAPATGEYEFSMKWSGSGNLMFNLRDMKTGKIVASDTSKGEPQTMSAELTAGRTYQIAVWSKTGKGRFTVKMTAPTVAPEPIDEPAPPAREPAPPVPEPEPPANPVGGDYPGRPNNGTLLWGAAIQGNGDPVSRHENAAGHSLTVRRTFYQWSARTGSMVTTARNDIANGRLPWVSVKTPSWTSMGNGDHDAEIDEMLRALDALNGPVWLTLHHEPDGGPNSNTYDDPGGPSAHVAMNRRVRERMTALGTDNIALAPILMSWAFNPASGRNPSDWWAPGIYDFFGVDHYQDNNKSMLNTTWASVRTWAASKGVEVAVGEWGLRGTDNAAGQRVQEWYNAAAGSHNDGNGARVVGLAAFDSGLNSPTGSWELRGMQLEVFRDLLGDSRTADPR